MKQILLLSLVSTLIGTGLYAQKTVPAPATPAIGGYNIKVTLKDFSAKEIYLGYTFADKKYLKDTAKAVKKGVYVFEGKEPLSGGVFFIYTPNKLFFEILVDENQHFSIESDTSNFVKNAKVKDSELNTVFFDFVNRGAPKQARMAQLDKRYKVLDKTKDADSIKWIREQLTTLDKEVKDLQDEVITKYPKLFFSKLLLGLRDPEIPEAPKNADGTKDSLFAGRYYKQHYWDNFDWNDNKLAYSEIFHNKLKTYFNHLILPVPDSLVAEAQRIFKNTANSKDLTKYATVYLYFFGDTSRIMGAENLAVYVGKNYYTPVKADWADSTTLGKIRDHVNSLSPLLIGKPAPNLRLADTTGKNFVNLANIKANYTILIFWDPTCGHCQKELPKLQSHYDEWKSKYGVEIFGIYTQREVEEWKKFIREKKLTFLQGAVWPDMATHPEKYIYDMGVTDIQSLNLHKTYYISSTPQVYLLDQNKTIVGRRLSVESIPKLLEGLEKEKETKNKP